ncbi:unnamed protein product [Lactuca virosa]|uniref:Secreted protein n=1 Tax=Lactuca virosa TaxID=75947 RepID=A0AAU9NPT8_9ASTR|nr:unnamed protein product [Lactuca virosa]
MGTRCLFDVLNSILIIPCLFHSTGHRQCWKHVGLILCSPIVDFVISRQRIIYSHHHSLCSSSFTNWRMKGGSITSHRSSPHIKLNARKRTAICKTKSQYARLNQWHGSKQVTWQ